MSIVFLILGAFFTFLVWGAGLTYESFTQDGNRNGQLGSFAFFLIFAGMSIVFLFSAGIAWVAP